MRKCPKCGREFATNERVCPDDSSLLQDTVSFEEQAIGRTLDGKYRIDGFLKRGGMGSVYRGTHLLLNKPVAIKLIRPELVTSQDMVGRFFREARAAAKLSHPNIVTVHDLGQTEDGTLYIIMELVDGKSLKETIQSEGPWEPKRALQFIRMVASALSLAHRNGIVHRDLKPQNIMVFRDSDGNEGPKLLDFGIAKTLEPDSPALTQTGMVLGTPHYMSSEQAKGLPADQRSDIYALGIILYEMLVGKVPFDDKSIPSILVKHLTEAPRPPSTLRGDIPLAVESLVLKCLEKDPENRIQSADDLGRALSSLADTASGSSAMPTIAMDPTVADAGTVEKRQEATMAGAAAARAPREPREQVPPPVPFPSAPTGDAPTRRMDSGTVRARDAHPPAAPPPPRAPAKSGSTAGIALMLVLGVLFLAALAVGGFLLLRNRNEEPEAPVATASTGLGETSPAATDPEPEPAPSESAPADSVPPDEAPNEPPGSPVPGTTKAPPVPRVKEEPPPREPASRGTAPTPPRVQPEPTPVERTERPSQAAPPAEDPVPDKPIVSIECEGVSDACGVLRVSLREELEKKGIRVAVPVRADVLVKIEAEEMEARTEQQFGNTFVIRTYSVTVDAEVPRFADSVSLPPRTFSFDARLGRDKLRGEAHVVATEAAERIARYWESKKP